MKPWASADWRLRRGRIVLLDGDSPAGLRLPLNSINWRPPRQTPEGDPLAEKDELGARVAEDDPAEIDDAPDAPTTAMVAEIRSDVGGEFLYIFMPPTEAADDFKREARAPLARRLSDADNRQQTGF